VNSLASVEIDAAGVKWFVGGNQLISFDGADWQSESLEPHGLFNVYRLAIGPDGSKWVATNGFGVGRLHGGVWTVLSPIPNNGDAVLYQGIAVEANGTAWLWTNNHGAASVQGTTVTLYNPDTSPLSQNMVSGVAFDADGLKWFLDGGSLLTFDGTTWTPYDLASTELEGGGVSSLLFDEQGDMWLAANRCVGGLCVKGVAHLANGHWTFNPHACGLLRLDGDHGAWCEADGDLAYTANDWVYPVDGDTAWLDDHTYRASYNFTSLIPRDTYSLSVAGAFGLDGVEIAPDMNFTFTVDYAGAITDQSAPSAPSVFASGDDADPSAVSAAWSSFDPESTLTGYRYAIGSAPGAVDIVNWTPTALSSATRAGLGLVPGQTYWVSAQAQNEGGLWSPLGMDAFVAGETKIVRRFLPWVVR
jgi:hypothetical protein